MTAGTSEVIEGFSRTIETEGVRAAFERYASEDYIQHNPWAAPGREGAIAYIEGLGAKGVRGAVKRMIVEGNMAVTHLHLSFTDGTPDQAIVDIWRVENGKIAEHWDVTQDIPDTVPVETMF